MAAVEVRMRTTALNEDGDYAITRTIIEGVGTLEAGEVRAQEAFGADWSVRGSAFVDQHDGETLTPAGS